MLKEDRGAGVFVDEIWASLPYLAPFLGRKGEKNENASSMKSKEPCGAVCWHCGARLSDLE